MSSIDERVVEAKFDNRQFQEGVKGTLNSLDSLKKGLNLDGTTKSLGTLSNAAATVSQHFSAMSVAGVTALATITTKAVNAGVQLVKSLTIGPIGAGLESYNEQINATQVILANTKAAGTSLKDVTATLADLQTYANLTVYSFSDMTSNIGRFTAAGVALQPATDAIKGMANVAALSGANTQQMGSAMYQMSQALSTGVIRLQDWNSLSNANMAGTNVQKALEATAHSMGSVGDVMDAAIKSQGNFRNSLQQGWLTSGIFTKTMKIMAGTIDQSTGKMKAFTVEQIRHMGYTAKDAKALQELSKSALDSAIKIRTVPQMMQALKEEVATAYSTIFKTIFGNINQATSTLTKLHTTLENALTGPIYAFNKVLQSWAALGGRTAAIDAFKNAWADLGAIFKPIVAAFHEIFHTTYGMDVTLTKLTFAVRDFFAKLKIGPETADKVKRVFAGLFAVLDIGWQLIKAGAHLFVQLFGAIGHSSGGILDFAASIGDMLVKLDNAIKSGHGFTKVFDAIGKVLTPIINMLGITRIRMLDLGIGLAALFKGLTQTAPKILNSISTAIHAFFNKLSGVFKFDKILQLINAGLFAGLLLLIRKFINHLKKRSEEPSPLQRFIDKITEPFTQLTKTLKEMQQAIMATTILEIAIAVGILTASVVALSMIDTVKLAKALGAITVMFAQLIGALWLFKKVGGAEGLFTTSAGLILFATALRVLTSSVKALADLSWQQLAKGLVGVTGLIGALILATKGLETKTGGMIRTGAGLLILAAAIKVLASAVTDISKLSWSEIARGLTGVGALLVGLTLFTKFSAANKGGLLQGAGLLLLGAAIKVLASAMQDFGKMSWGNIAKGLVTVGAILVAFTIFSKTVGNPVKMLAASAALVAVGVAMNALAASMLIFGKLSWGEVAKGLVSMAGALLLIVFALNSMPITSALSAAALVAVSVALTAIGVSMQLMGHMSWGEVAKGLIVLAGALTIISIAMDAMVFALPGAAALLVVAASLAILIPELAVLGAMSVGNIVKALLAIAGAFVVFGVAADALSESIPLMFGLAGSIALLGVGLAAVGAGVYLFATGLQILAVAGAGAAASIKVIFDSLLSLLPKLATTLGLTLVALSKAIAKAAPELLRTAIILIDGLLTAINREGPKIIRTFLHLVESLLKNLADAIPKMAKSMYRILMGILDVIEQRTPSLVNKWTDIIVKFLQAMTKNTPRIATAATDWIVAIIKSIDDNLQKIIDAGTDLVVHFIKGIGKASNRVVNAAADTLIAFLHGLAKTIREKGPLLGDAGWDIAKAIVVGFWDGLKHGLGGLFGKVAGVFGSIPVIAARELEVNSPSKVFIRLGKYVAQGFAIGIIGGKDVVVQAWQKLHDNLKTAVDSTKQTLDSYNQKMKSLEAHPAKNADAIAKLSKKIREMTKEYNASKSALDLVNDGLQKQHDHLIRLGKRYDENAAKLDKATQKLRDAKQARDDYNKSIKDQYYQLPDVSADTTLADYITSEKTNIVDTQSFIEVLAKLRKRGLDDKTYRMLLEKGPETLPFAEEILAGGKKSIDQLNSLDSQLHKEAKGLGGTASTELYQAGVDSAQGLVDGLKAKREAIAKEMRHIAHALVVELKKELKIKSPSQVFDELGQYTGKGLARGLKKSIPHVQRATRTLGQNTVESMKESIREMNNLLAVEGNLNPTITPILDLSAVRRQATGVGNILGDRLAVTAAYAKAMNASSGYEANLVDLLGGDIPETAPGGVTFIQNNNSPKALSTAEIYRNTNNQLSRVRGALNPSAT